ncbi:MAG: 4-(cytidine 5'-diphospho)-2-C-methyl-D-erythritol kinase [Helicobacteraceae bacterium]|nr:4-(cytidine 5'-diphospho)-2-C-methyl-D-erythritol kinase [Helicobacteraceae bacterium]
MTYPSYPKINICFKIISILENGYCNIASRYVKIKDSFFDTLEFRTSPSFKIRGNFGFAMEENIIFKAKEILKKEILDSRLDSTLDSKKARFLENFSIEVQKKIPLCSGLGGGSSNAATYLLAMNEILELGLNKAKLGKIASKIGADVSFFIYEFSSANVYGIGDRIVEFSETLPKIEIITNPLKCETKAVFDEFKKNTDFSDLAESNNLLKLDSKNLMLKHNICYLNDLFAPALKLYPNLKEHIKDGYFFSGSGSSLFKLKD